MGKGVCAEQISGICVYARFYVERFLQRASEFWIDKCGSQRRPNTGVWGETKTTIRLIEEACIESQIDAAGGVTPHKEHTSASRDHGREGRHAEVGHHACELWRQLLTSSCGWKSTLLTSCVWSWRTDTHSASASSCTAAATV